MLRFPARTQSPKLLAAIIMNIRKKTIFDSINETSL